MYLFSVLHTVRQGWERNKRCILEIEQLLRFMQQSNNQIFVNSIMSQQPFDKKIEKVCRDLFILLTLHNEKPRVWQ